MGTIVFGGALSHSPMMNLPIPRNHEEIHRFKAGIAKMSELIRRSRPDVLVVFGPDHFRALFYDLMPAFVIGVGHVQGWGDWNTPVGPFPADSEFASHILNTVREQGFDPAFSYDIKVDHGVTQPLQLLELTDVPIVPILINAAGPPLPSPSRCHRFGTAVGHAIQTWKSDVRVAVIGSGGLSHDPPSPERENAVYGRSNGFASSRERETVLMRKADVLEARINPDWDRRVLDHFRQRRVAVLAQELTEQSIYSDAGNGGQEIRNWIAVAGALGDPPMSVLCYEPIPALVTGMAVVVAEEVGA